jgi:8-oxo-dGTP pyrophosphatase MutT (NUDIX family)
MKQIKLVDVRRAFTRWRASKGRPGEPVPESLWARAVDAARVHGPTQTARRLGLNHSALKKRIDRAESSAPDFVELPLGLVSAPESTVELEDAAGARLRLVLPGAKPQEVAAAARELWGARP